MFGVMTRSISSWLYFQPLLSNVIKHSSDNQADQLHICKGFAVSELNDHLIFNIGVPHHTIFSLLKGWVLIFGCNEIRKRQEGTEISFQPQICYTAGGHYRQCPLYCPTTRESDTCSLPWKHGADSCTILLCLTDFLWVDFRLIMNFWFMISFSLLIFEYACYHSS